MVHSSEVHSHGFGGRRRSLKAAVDQVEEKINCAAPVNRAAIGDEFVHRHQRNQEIVDEGGIAPNIPASPR